MDVKSIRKTLTEITGELADVDARREKLLAAHKGLEALLTLKSGSGDVVVTVPTAHLKLSGGPRPKGTRSLRGAVLQIVQDARGAPLHSAEILKRARAMGAETAAKDPKAIIDLMLYSLKKSGKPVEKTAPRTWRYIA